MSQSEKPAIALRLSLIAGFLIVCNAVAVGVAGTYFPGIFPTLPGSDNNATVPFTTISIIALISGALILLAAVMLQVKPENKKAWDTNAKATSRRREK